MGQDENLFVKLTKQRREETLPRSKSSENLLYNPQGPDKPKHMEYNCSQTVKVDPIVGLQNLLSEWRKLKNTCKEAPKIL